MSGSGDSSVNPQVSSSASGIKRKVESSGTPNETQLRRKRKQILETVAKKLSDNNLFSHVLVVAAQPDGQIYTFATPAAYQEHITQEDFMSIIQPSFVRKSLTPDEKMTLLSRYGNPPTCKAAFVALNTNSLRMLLRSMGFNDLQKIFSEGDEEKMPEHMRAHSESYAFTGAFLDPDNSRGAQHKFSGKNKSNGRFQAQNIPEEILSQSQDMWKPGPCPNTDNAEYTTFETVMSTHVNQMTRPMLIIAVGIQLECVHPGIYY